MSQSGTTQSRTDTSTTLDDLADLPRWVAWRLEQRQNKDGKTKETKVPYNPNAPERKAASDDPTTWGTRAEAEQGWQAIRRQALRGVGGVGIVLGQLDDDYYLMGIDLDGCINPKTNQFRPWAGNRRAVRHLHRNLPLRARRQTVLSHALQQSR
jgi:primase-polymerase (primpol)-like protein